MTYVFVNCRCHCSVCSTAVHFHILLVNIVILFFLGLTIVCIFRLHSTSFIGSRIISDCLWF